MRQAQTSHDQALCSSGLSHETCTNFARRLGRPLTVMAGAEAVQAAAARIAATHNVAIDLTAARARLTPTGLAAVNGSPWAGEAASCQDLRCNAMSRVLRLSEQQAAIRIWSTSTERQQTRQLECGGDGTGSLWLVTPDTTTTRLPDAHWRIATRYRLALTLAPPCRSVLRPAG